MKILVLHKSLSKRNKPQITSNTGIRNAYKLWLGIKEIIHLSFSYISVKLKHTMIRNYRSCGDRL